jgi:hypothetical protein
MRTLCDIQLDRLHMCPLPYEVSPACGQGLLHKVASSHEGFM